MTVITMKMTVLVFGPLIGVSLQLTEKCQGFFVLDLHQDLVDRGSQWGEACEPPCRVVWSTYPSVDLQSLLSFVPCPAMPPPIFPSS